MTSSKQNSSLLSTTSSHLESYEDVSAKNNVKDLLKSRIFLGRYLERRLVDKRIGYRDVVLLSPAEVELKKDLLEAQHKLKTLHQTIHWIGISDSDGIGYSNGVCLWTEIDNQPFGVFWFQIKSIKFRDSEIIVVLKFLRHISDAFLEVEPILTGAADKCKGNISKQIIESNLTDAYNDIVFNFKSILSVSNVKDFFTFIFAFVIAVFTGGNAFIVFLGNFILALVREMSILIKNSTPIFLGFLDFLSKIVGGFYILLAMFFKPNPQKPLNKQSIGYYDPRNYDHRNFD